MDSELDDIDGCILNIHVKNFFCHDNLEINFNNNVNFIVGRNGSGKSAVLTALVVGLGARAAATNRGNSIVSFIKKGSNSATIEIKIKNSSEKSYKHNVYGDTITIVRHITSSGSSSYKVKSDKVDFVNIVSILEWEDLENCEVISTKLEEVHAVTLAHDIQVDNPISVLNQDDARSFHASDAKKKYSLFRKATNLDQTEENYVRALQNCEKAKMIWSKKNEAFQVLEKELKKWQGCYEALQSKDEFIAEQRKLQDEYYWSEIAELEREVEVLNKEYDKCNQKILGLRHKLESIVVNSESGSDVIRKLKEKLESKSHEHNKIETKIADFEEKKRVADQELKNIHVKQKKYEDVLKREKSKIQDLQREIESINSEDLENNRAALERQVEQAEENLKAVRARIKTSEHHVEQTRQNTVRSKQQTEELVNKERHMEQNLRKIQQFLGDLDTKSTDSLSVYGKNMVELVKRIKQAHAQKKFSQMPRGPVGGYIKVKDRKWASVIEHLLGGSIQQFCVNTQEDMRVLFKLMEDVYQRNPKPGVTCSKFFNTVHKVGENKVRSNSFVSSLDAIDVSDPVIANYLIDNLGVEHVLLVPDHDDAIRLSDNVENVPLNCKKIITLDCTEYHPAPDYRSYGGAGKVSRYLQTSSAERRKQLENERRNLEQEMQKLRSGVEESRRKADEAEATAHQAAKVLMALRADCIKKEECLRIIRDKLQMQTSLQQRVLIEELDESKERVKKLESEIGAISPAYNQLSDKIKLLKDEIGAKNQQKAEIATELMNITQEIGEEQLKIDRGISEKSSLESRIQKNEEQLSKIEDLKVEKESTLTTKTEEALQLCPRVEDTREKSIIVNELKRMQAKLNSVKSFGLSKAQVAAQLIEVQKKYKHTKNLLDKLNTLITEVRKTSDKHLRYCHRVQTSISRRVQYCFQAMLSLRGYSGSMDINNCNGTLDITCSGRDAGDKRLAASTSSLSGGERSYATVAFVMALWECVELPFYFLDEFDVFMDNVNRKIVMDILLDHALSNKNRQFCFLTPQDASSVKSGPHITIHRMANPRD